MHSRFRSLASFETTIEEIEAQKTDIPSYGSYLNSLNLDETLPDGSVFVGAGDSLACAMFMERSQGFRPRSSDPSELYRNPEICRGKVTHFISVSGRTKSNIEAATLVGGIAKRKIAITANSQSVLARSCSKVIELRFTKLSDLTPGTGSFTASLLACYRIFNKIPVSMDLQLILSKAKMWAGSQNENPDAVHFVASDHLFPIASYGAAKVMEISGCRADCQITEEFSHINLFSLDKKDLVIIIKGGSGDWRELKLANELNRDGYCAQLLQVGSASTTTLEEAICGAIHSQCLALNMAIRRGLNQPAFLENQKLLGLSNRMIYFD